MTIDAEVSAARKRIFRDGYDISFGELVSLYGKKELIIQPEYQRLFRWDQTQKTRFIESLLLGLSKAIEHSAEQLDVKFVQDRISEVPKLPAAEKYSGSGVRGTQRLASFVMPFAEDFFDPKK